MNARERRQVEEQAARLKKIGEHEIAAKLLALAARRRKASPSQPTREKASEEARRERAEKMAQIRAAVEKRSRGLCEACHGAFLQRGALDHWLGGTGRRRQMESIETCWLLCWSCNHMRTHNSPTSESWNRIFEAHCKAHGYRFTPHVEHANAARTA